MDRHIVLIGMMGAGKTAVGGELSRKLKARFIDSDHEIESAAAMTIAEIFARDGEEFFRARESEVLRRLLDGPPMVISTGGGAWLRAENREMIKQKGLSVWLDCDLETLWNRVRMRSTRPLLKTPDPKGTLTQMLETRRPYYAMAELIYPVQPGDTVDQTATRLLGMIREHHPETLGQA
ncbi:shikimate kinase [Paracoccus zhejiangensis]|uniref:Shikimate kinase n=1 Tax=Paracoccus zhejiangensis TaxID=1077935 RepID=A0A2H5EV47_9RHOB|nr:shikimate kinase [Paracoccus zhejiangensis]AUH63164.1 shikimate kinase [Paracoccus zhejiangensis]